MFLSSMLHAPCSMLEEEEERGRRKGRGKGSATGIEVTVQRPRRLAAPTLSEMLDGLQGTPGQLRAVRLQPRCSSWNELDETQGAPQAARRCFSHQHCVDLHPHSCKSGVNHTVHTYSPYGILIEL